MFKRVMIVLVVVAMFFSGAMVVSADEGQTSTSILVQNLTAADNPITLNFYKTTGGDPTAGTKTKTLAAEASTTFDQRYASGDPGTGTDFQGAAVLSAEGAIGAVVQMVRSGGSGSVNSYDAYNGLGDTSVAQLIKAPLLLRGVTSAGKTWNTMMSIQNTSLTASAHVTVTYAPDGLGNAYTASYTIPGGGSQYVKHETETNLGAKFFGSATIAADQDVGVVVTSGVEHRSARATRRRELHGAHKGSAGDGRIIALVNGLGGVHHHIVGSAHRASQGLVFDGNRHRRCAHVDDGEGSKVHVAQGGNALHRPGEEGRRRATRKGGIGDQRGPIG